MKKIQSNLHCNKVVPNCKFFEKSGDCGINQGDKLGGGIDPMIKLYYMESMDGCWQKYA